MIFKFTCYVVYAAVRLLHLSYRYRYIDEVNKVSSEEYGANNAMIMATWHNNCFGGILAHTFQNFNPLMSKSKDGDLVAFVCERMGIAPVRGSSSRGGKEAREQIVENFKRGYSSAITVDGPKGPIYEVKMGIVDIARRGNVAILPFGAIADRYWTLKSWDRFRIPKPFARIRVFYGEPIVVSLGTVKEQQGVYAEQIQKALMIIEASAKRPCK